MEKGPYEMKTLLDLIQEFAVLNEAKTLAGGVLPSISEQRWQELKKFYDLLMAQEDYCERPASCHCLDEIRQSISARTRLRVPTEMDAIVQRQSDYVSASIGNLSCGGVLLKCDTAFDVGTRLTLHLTNIERSRRVIIAQGDVVWVKEWAAGDGPRYLMGFCFTTSENDLHNQLDSFIVESIEKRLNSLPLEKLAPEFLRREQIQLNA
jgi:Tfp pilus assembly protein PilZ